MAKVVRWRGQFADIENKQYTVEIYGEQVVGVGVKTITLGANPLVTDEDDSDDPMEKGRGITGVLEVYDEDGNLLEDIMPDDDISRPVIVSTGNDIVWRGFICSETYNIEYSCRGRILQLNLLSVLQAMDSVEIDQSEEIAFTTIYKHIAYCFMQFTEKVGMNMITALYADDKWVHGFNKYLYSSSFFETKEKIEDSQEKIDPITGDVTIIEGNNVVNEIRSNSIKVILEKIACIFCCHVCEHNGEVYIVPNFSKSFAYNKATYEALVYHLEGGELYKTFGESVELDSKDFDYVEHQTISIMRGARHVSVDANLHKFDIEIKEPGTPPGDMLITDTLLKYKRAYTVLYKNQNFNNTYEFYRAIGSYSLTYRGNVGQSSGVPTGVYGDYSIARTDVHDIDTFFRKCIPVSGIMSDLFIAWNNQNASIFKGSYNPFRMNSNVGVCAVMAKLHTYDGVEPAAFHETTDGLMLIGFPMFKSGEVPISFNNTSWSSDYCDYQTRGYSTQRYLAREIDFLYSAKTTGNVIVNSGFLNISVNIPCVFGNSLSAMECPEGLGLFFALKFGNKFWNNGEGTWTDTFSRFRINFKNDGTIESNYDPNTMNVRDQGGFYIPVPQGMYGEVKIMLFSEVAMKEGSEPNEYVCDVFISKLDVYYMILNNINDYRSKNTYASSTGNKSDDEIVVSTDLATDCYNLYSDNMLYDDSTKATTLISIEGEESKLRPEKEMLRQMKIHYAKRRNILEFNMSPLEHDIHISRIIDKGKTYVPVSESRDWRMNKSTIKMIETE